MTNDRTPKTYGLRFRHWPLVMGHCLLPFFLAGCLVGPNQPEEPLPGNTQDQAEALVDRIKDNPLDIEAHADLLRLQIQRGDVEGARNTYTHAIFHNPKDFRSHMLAAQFHRWQLDLLTAEKELIAARELVPTKVEPRIALAALYREATLENEELEQRRIVVELAELALKPEFDLDFAYALAQAGRIKDAEAAAWRVIAAPGTKARMSAHLLLSQLALDAGDEAACVASAIEARKCEPKERGPIRYMARLTSALKDPSGLMKVFEEALATQEDPEIRFAALFGSWVTTLKAAIAKGQDPDGNDPHAFWTRLRDLDPNQVDALSRRYQVVKLLPQHEPEAKALQEQLEEQKIGLPAVPGTLGGLMRSWRAEDCLRLSAPRPCLEEISFLEGRETGLTGLNFLKVQALFVAREFEKCRALLKQLVEQAKEESEEFQLLRWQLDLMEGKAPELARQFETEGEKTTNAGLWVRAVARFHTYRKQNAGGGK